MLELGAATVTGQTLGESITGARVWNDDVIRPLEQPLTSEGGLAILRGSLAPGGAVIKPIAADKNLLEHHGPAVVFDDYDELEALIDREDLDVTPASMLVLRNAGPVGGPGMPEWGMLPLPRKLLVEGVRDMVRISDARMSGTGYGTCVLHVSPESAVGGPLSLVRTGDRIALDVPRRRLDLLVDDVELAQRRAALIPRAPHFGRGYGRLFSDHVTQAELGCDFDFLGTGPQTPEPPIH
jgi:dihydroxy-acid dehydratase